MMKALYLDGGGGMHVGIDGPALRVRRPGRADGRYPLPRVARVIAIGRVSWKSEALKTCLRFGKPVSVLDRGGRFVRILFRPLTTQYGLARHMGELLAVPRYRQRYLRWYLETEQVEMRKTVRMIGIGCQITEPIKVWARICLEQHRRWKVRPGRYYRYFLGLAAAQLAGALSRIGMPRNPHFWGREEYRLFCRFLLLERWRLAALLDEILSRNHDRPGRQELTAAFESLAGERDVRIEGWRRQALLAMTGIQAYGKVIQRQPAHGVPVTNLQSELMWFCRGASARNGAPWSQDVSGERRPIRKTVRLLRAHLVEDRRVHESHGTA